MLLVKVQSFGTGTRYDLEILRNCGKEVETESQKVLGSNSYVCRSYMGKLVGGFLQPILNMVKVKQTLEARDNN